MFNDRSTPLSLVRTRRSGRPKEMVGPGPDRAEILEIIAEAARVPDHGKLSPWRLLVVDDRDAFAALLRDALRAEDPDAKPGAYEMADGFARQAPVLVAVLSAPVSNHKVPVWEQELSAGALCMNLLTTAHAHGYVAGWLTGWPAYSQTVARALSGAGEQHRVAGFIYVGQPSLPLQERPRPDLARIVGRWPSAA